MKKSLIALAVLGSMVGAAAAQSSVTLFGGVDLNVRYNKGGGKTFKTMGTDGIYSSRWGLRGVEDLGGGLKAGFWLEAALNPDDGTINSSGKFWHRRASVSLLGDFGEVRLGRYLTNQFTAFADFDPFGTNGVGDVNKYFGSGGHAINGRISNSTRADNIVGYFLPSNLGGIYGSVEVAAGEGTVGNKYVGGRVGYAAGPLNVSGAYSVSDLGQTDYKRFTASGSYDLGVVKLMGFYSQNKLGAAKQKIGLIGASAPLGSGTVRASYTKATNSSQIAVGYVHDLSKRTALYSTVARVSNKTGASAKVAGPSAWTIGSGADNGGVEVGLRHTF